MKLKTTMTNQKLRGGYYTPEIISDFLTKWAIENKSSSVLEPSCGDGVFLESLFKIGNKKKINEIFAIEFEPKEAKKVTKIVNQNPSFKKACNVVTGDFFKFFNQKLKNKKFDVILGNPPYIRYQYFENGQMEEALKIMESAGIKSNKLTNIWAPFLVAGMMCLNDGGRLGMVIPGEMLHVNYSSDVRLLLSKFPAKITIITFKELVFPDVQQEIMLMLIEKEKSTNRLQEKIFNSSIDILQLKNIKELRNFLHIKFINCFVRYYKIFIRTSDCSNINSS